MKYTNAGSGKREWTGSGAKGIITDEVPRIKLLRILEFKHEGRPHALAVQLKACRGPKISSWTPQIVGWAHNHRFLAKVISRYMRSSSWGITDIYQRYSIRVDPLNQTGRDQAEELKNKIEQSIDISVIEENFERRNRRFEQITNNEYYFKNCRLSIWEYYQLSN